MSILIPRNQMPQIDEEFIPQLMCWLGLQGYGLEAGYAPFSVPIRHQSVGEYDINRFVGPVTRKPILAADDWGVLDGNHRSYGHAMLKSLIPYIKIKGLDFSHGVALLGTFPHTYFINRD